MQMSMYESKCDMYTDCIWCDCYDWDSESCTMPSIHAAYACSLEQDTESQDDYEDWGGTIFSPD